MVSDVPEPRKLDTLRLKDGEYLVAIAGRGTQTMRYVPNA